MPPSSIIFAFCKYQLGLPFFFLSIFTLNHSEADQQSFQFYKSGVFDDPECGENLDHGVAAVGYGTSDDGKDYFKVRNSWVRNDCMYIQKYLSTICPPSHPCLFLLEYVIIVIFKCLHPTGCQLGRRRIYRKYQWL